MSYISFLIVTCPIIAVQYTTNVGVHGFNATLNWYMVATGRSRYA